MPDSHRRPPISLRLLLTLPYVALLLLLALLVGGLSYVAARHAVRTLSDQLLTETVARISQSIEGYVLDSSAVLEVAFPAGLPAPDRMLDDLDALRTRFWLASSMHGDLRTAFYGDVDGRFVGIMQMGKDLAELRLRTDPRGPRMLYELHSLRATPMNGQQESRMFDPRERLWFQAAVVAKGDVWTPVYVDFRSHELVATRARAVQRRDGSVGGVVGTDVSLRSLGALLKALPLTPNGLAFVVEPGGNLIATSRGETVQRREGANTQQINASQSKDPLLAATYAEVQKLTQAMPAHDSRPRASQIDVRSGDVVHVAYARLHDHVGLTWIVAVAVPRDDFLHGVTRNLYLTLALSVVAALITVAVGLVVLGVVARDLRKLAEAARQIGEGEFDTPIRIRRNDEIGQVAASFEAMRARLSTDRLTGLANRDALMRRAEARVHLHRRGTDTRPFTVLFLDIDGFKPINDRLGHDAGDQVLVALGQRMARQLREADCVARWAGDEFVVLLDGVQAGAETAAVCAKLAAAIAEPLETPTEAVGHRLSVSIGSASYPADGEDVAHLIQVADARMYEAKREWKARDTEPT